MSIPPLSLLPVWLFFLKKKSSPPLPAPTPQSRKGLVPESGSIFSLVGEETGSRRAGELQQGVPLRQDALARPSLG